MWIHKSSKAKFGQKVYIYSGCKPKVYLALFGQNKIWKLILFGHFTFLKMLAIILDVIQYYCRSDVILFNTYFKSHIIYNQYNINTLSTSANKIIQHKWSREEITQ